MYYFLKIKKLLLFIVFFIFPFISFAQVGEEGGLIPCKIGECNFNDLIILAQNIIEFLILLAIPLAVIAFSYAGFLYLTAGGDEGKVKSAHKIFGSVLMGLFFVLGAWLVVYFMVSALGVDDEFTGILSDLDD